MTALFIANVSFALGALQTVNGAVVVDTLKMAIHMLVANIMYNVPLSWKQAAIFRECRVMVNKQVWVSSYT